MNDTELLRIIKEAAFEVRRHLAPGYLESVYRNALMIELNFRGLNVSDEVPISVYYKSVKVGDFRADLIVENRIILEIKACRELHPSHEIQLVNYLVATNLDWGYLINYGGDKYRIIKKSRVYIPGE